MGQRAQTRAASDAVRVMHVVYTLRTGGMEMGVVKLVNGLDPVAGAELHLQHHAGRRDQGSGRSRSVPVFELVAPRRQRRACRGRPLSPVPARAAARRAHPCAGARCSRGWWRRGWRACRSSSTASTAPCSCAAYQRCAAAAGLVGGRPRAVGVVACWRSAWRPHRLSRRPASRRSATASISNGSASRAAMAPAPRSGCRKVPGSSALWGGWCR